MISFQQLLFNNKENIFTLLQFEKVRHHPQLITNSSVFIYQLTFHLCFFFFLLQGKFDYCKCFESTSNIGFQTQSKVNSNDIVLHLVSLCFCFLSLSWLFILIKKKLWWKLVLLVDTLFVLYNYSSSINETQPEVPPRRYFFSFLFN